MSSSHHGKEKQTSTAKQSILSYFNKPHLKNVALHDIGSSSSKQPVLEHDFNGSRGVGSSSTLDSHGNSSGLETGLVSKFPFIELVPSENEKNTSKEVRWCISNARPTEWPLCKVQVHGEEVEGILDQSKLVEQSSCFGQTMWRQFQQLEDPLKNGAITRLWNILGASQYLQENMSEYFKLADLCQTMILGSVEDERVFSLLSFLKSKLRNKLNKHLDPCLRLYVTKYNINNFPFDRALALWRSDCDRRGKSSILNLSNPSTTDKDCMEIDNDILCQGDQVQDVEDEDQVEN
eukprot:Gb_23573 [translate_table: standard]